LPTALAGFDIEYEPIYIRGLELFKVGLPYNATKSRYLMSDLNRTVKHHDIPLQFPAQFPVNGLYGVRGAIVAQQHGVFEAYDDAVWKATWVEERNVSDATVIVQIAGEVGIDEAVFAEAIRSQEIKTVLRESTEAAEAKGVFGLPAFVVGKELFWGHDRLDYVKRALQGA